MTSRKTDNNDRPLSPSTNSSATQSSSPFPTTSPRIARTSHIEASTREGGLRATIYLRLALPVSDSPTTFHLLTLNSHSHLLHHSFYELPLLAQLSSTDPEALVAARHLDISIASSPEDAVQGTIGRALGRDSRAFGGADDRKSGIAAKLIQDDKEISIVLSPSWDGSGFESSEKTKVPGSPRTPQNKVKARRPSHGSATFSKKDGDVKRLEWLLVLRVDVSHGGVQSPLFADTIFLALPPCLRNTLAFTLPTPPSSSTKWDLAITPSFRPHSDSPKRDSRGSETVLGNFPSTTSLALRWAPHRPSTSATTPSLRLSSASMKVAWSISEQGWGTVAVNCTGRIDRWPEVYDRAFLDVRVAAQTFSAGVREADRFFKVISVQDGDEDSEEPESPVVTSWEIIRSRQSIVKSPSDDDAVSDGPSTPIPRRRPPTPSSNQPRPPSFTSLFDTPPPQPVDIAPEVKERMKSPSLMLQKAPFGKDGQEEVGDMSFEMSEDDNTKIDVNSNEGEGGLDNNSTTIRLFLKLSSVIVPSKMPTPTLSFRITASFPGVTLLGSDVSLPTLSPLQSQFRLALPSFSIPSSESEATLVTCSAGPGGAVELLSNLASAGSADSPLPAVSGKARWRTERSKGSQNSRARKGIEEIFEIEVSTKGDSRPTSLLVLDDEPRQRKRTFSDQSRPSESLRSRTSASLLSPTLPATLPPTTSISSLAIRITSVPSTSTWRLFTHLTFPHPFIGSFNLRTPSGNKIELCGAWNADGREVGGEIEWTEKHALTSVHVEQIDGKGLRELLFVDNSPSRGGKVAVGAVLPQFNLKVAEMAVEVLAVQDFGLETSLHSFDTCTPQQAGACTRFSRFLLPPSATSNLNITFSSSIPAPLCAQKPRSFSTSLVPAAAVFMILFVLALACHQHTWFEGLPAFPSALTNPSVPAKSFLVPSFSDTATTIISSSASSLLFKPSDAPSPSAVATPTDTRQDEEDEEEDADETEVGWSNVPFESLTLLTDAGKWAIEALFEVWHRLVGLLGG